MKATIYPGACSGRVVIPPSKSIAHRAIICAGLCRGQSTIRNVSLSADIIATINCMRQLGAQIEIGMAEPLTGAVTLKITGVVSRNMIAMRFDSHTIIDCDESGSTLRFLLPLFSLANQPVSLTGKPGLLKRPQTVYADIFRSQGKSFIHDEHGIHIDEALEGGIFELPGNVSSQFISGLFFALAMAEEDSVIKVTPPFESASYVDLTIQTMAEFGADVLKMNDHTFLVKGESPFEIVDLAVEGDYSQLAFWAVLAAINRPLELSGVSLKSRQGDRAIIEMLKEFGASCSPAHSGYQVSCEGTLKAAPLDLADCPDLGPVLTVLAAAACGTTEITNAGRLRIKESDRIAAMEAELVKLGIHIESTADTITVTGCRTPGFKRGALKGGVEVDGHNDHRVVMSLAVLATICKQPVTICGAEAVNKSYPRFFDDLKRVGIKVELTEE